MKTFLFSEQTQQKFEENSQYMGASIENQHLQAGLLERLHQTKKCQIVTRKVKQIKAAKSSNERPQIILDDDSVIEPLLLVGSDGEKSLTRSEYNIGTWGQ